MDVVRTNRGERQRTLRQDRAATARWRAEQAVTEDRMGAGYKKFSRAKPLPGTFLADVAQEAAAHRN